MRVFLRRRSRASLIKQSMSLEYGMRLTVREWVQVVEVIRRIVLISLRKI